MKRMTIFFACLATLLFTTSCSKEAGLPGTPAGSFGTDGKLHLRVYASGASKAADGVELPGESTIHNVGVALFSAETDLLLTDAFWGSAEVVDGTWTVLNIPSNSQKAKIVIVANCPESLFAGLNAASSYTAFRTQLAQLSDQRQDNLTMSSQVIVTEQPLVMGDNYIGYESMGGANINGINRPLELTRLAARIEVISIRTSFSRLELTGRQVRVNSIYIANQKQASHLFSENYWGVVVAAGQLGDSEPTEILRVAPIPQTVYTHYVMENNASEQPTQVVVNATLLSTPGYEAETKSFAATVNLGGVLSTPGVEHRYVRRNHVYRLKINFTDTSFDGTPEPPTPPVPPVTGLLDVKVEVAPWGPVNQSVEIE